jgi:hypothetical protein
VIALCGAICGVDTWADIERFALTKEEWFRRFLELEHGIPSHDTFGRVFAQLDTDEFYECLQQWVQSLSLCLQGQGVHIDGKTIRRSFDSATGTSALQVVNAWAGELNLCLGQIAVEPHSRALRRRRLRQQVLHQSRTAGRGVLVESQAAGETAAHR